MKWNETTAFLGGTFDPPHLGHLEAARGLLRFPGVKDVVIVPSGNPPWKSSSISLEHRLALTHLTFEPEFKVDLTEVELAQKNPNVPTTSYETLQILKQRYGEKIAFVIGFDQLQSLPRWHRFPEILGLCHWIALARKPLSLTHSLPPGIQKRLIIAETEAPALSSTALREHFAKTGQIPPNTLSPGVVRYLREHGLYAIEPQQGNTAL